MANLKAVPESDSAPKPDAGPVIAKLKVSLKGDENSDINEVKDFVRRLHRYPESESTLDYLNEIAEALNSVERTLLVGIISLYTEPNPNSNYLLETLSSLQLGEEQKPVQSEKGFSSFRQVRFFERGDLNGELKGTHKPKSNTVKNLETDGYPTHKLLEKIKNGLEAARLGQPRIWEDLKDICRYYFSGPKDRTDQVEDLVEKLKEEERIAFLGLALLYGYKVDNLNLEALFSQTSMAQKVIESMSAGTKRKVTEVLSI